MKTGTIRAATHTVLDLQVWLFLIPRIKAPIRLMERQSSGGSTVVFIRNPFREQRDANRLFAQSADSRVPLSRRSRLYRCWKNVCKEHETGLKWGAVVYIFGLLSRLLQYRHIKAENAKPKVTRSLVFDRYVLIGAGSVARVGINPPSMDDFINSTWKWLLQKGNRLLKEKQ